MSKAPIRYRLSTALLVLCFFIACNSKHEKFSIVSSTDGEIKKIIVCTEGTSDLYTLNYLTELQKVFGKDKVLPVYKTSALDPNNGKKTKGRLNFWVQDVFIPLQQFSNEEDVKFIYSAGNERMLNSVIRIKETLPYIDTLAVSIDNLEGGNVLAFGNHVLISKAILYTNYEQNKNKNGLAAFQNELERELKNSFNMEHIIWTGFAENKNVPVEYGSYPVSQAIFHIDMYLTPSGIIVNDSNLIFIAEIDTSFYTPKYLQVHNRLHAIDSLNQLIAATGNDFNSFYQQYHKSDTALKPFTFRKIPLLIEFFDNSNAMRYYHSLNNAHVEVYGNVRNIYASKYKNTGFINYTAAMEKAEQAYASEGFKTTFIGPYANRIGNGALHCYSKVVWRKKK
jgi:hypothetical protein